jgi:hypothetical protein
MQISSFQNFLLVISLVSLYSSVQLMLDEYAFSPVLATNTRFTENSGKCLH